MSNGKYCRPAIVIDPFKMAFFSICVLLSLVSTSYVTAQESDTQPIDDQISAVGEAEEGQQPEAIEQIRVDAFRSVAGLENWHYDYDISGYDKGKYNIIIQGTDKAGNIYAEGPFNILIDPESDLPVVNVSNPTPLMRVGGNLNIVGTCIDDDAVASVQVKIGDGEYQDADGTDFWSFYLDTTDFEDGQYTISARGIDINGKVGTAYAAAFNLDKAKPVNALTSHENGALVSGKLTLDGVVSDLNGIENLFYSEDGGQTFQRLVFKKDKEAKEIAFQLKIDTTKQPEGPQIYWFRSTDQAGSTGLAAFLFFVDNKPPEIQFLYPNSDDQINGRFYVSGAVEDEIGVDTLTWQTGKDEPQEIPLAPGNPYWIQEFDFTGKNKATVEFTITDKAGNVKTEKLDLILDHEGDKPIVDIVYPRTEEHAFNDRFAGFVRDDDGVQGIVYSIDGGEEISYKTGQAFDIDLDPLTTGQHRINFRAVDINGVESEEQRISFIKNMGPPAVAIDAIIRKEGEAIGFQPGMEVDSRLFTAISGTITFPNTSGNAEFYFGQNEPKSISLKRAEIPGNFSFTIPIDAERIPYGFVDLTVRVVDSLELDTTYSTYIFVRNLTRNHAEHDIYFSDERPQANGGALITKDRPLRGRYIGYSADTIFFEPEIETVSVTQNNGYIEIKQVREGASEQALLKLISDRGIEFSSGPLKFVTDISAPKVKIDSSVKSGRIRSSVALKGTVTDNVGLKSAAYLIGDKQYPLSLAEEENVHAYSASIPAGRFPDGGVLLTVAAEDEAGNTARDYRVFNNTPPFVADPEATKDPVPVVQIVFPTDGSLIFPEDLVSGNVYVGGIVTGVPRVTGISYSLDGGDSRSASGGDVFELKFPELAAGRHTLSVSATSDKEVAGRQVSISFTVVGPVGAIELTHVESTESLILFKPGMDIPIQEKVSLLATISGSSDIADITYSIDQSEPVKARITVTEEEGRAVAVPLAQGLDFGSHTITIHAADKFERTFEFGSFFYAVEHIGDRLISEKEGIFIADMRFAGPNADVVKLAKRETVLSHFNGRKIIEVGIEPVMIFSLFRIRKIRFL